MSGDDAHRNRWYREQNFPGRHLANEEFLFSAYWYRLPVSFETYPCDTCGRQYRRVISLQRHKRLECGKEAQFECVLCHAKFKHKHSLLRHYNVHVADVKKSSYRLQLYPTDSDTIEIQRTAPVALDARNPDIFEPVQTPRGQLKYKCPNCNRFYMRTSCLKRHLRVECGQAPKYRCNVCQGWFKHKHNLTSHIKLHVKQPSYHCDLCAKKFYRRDKLMNHQRKLHKILLDGLTYSLDQPLRRGPVRWELAMVQMTPYQCPKCFKYFKSSKSCCNHRSTCGTDKKFRCAFCDYRSHQKGNVVRHLATQHPEANDTGENKAIEENADLPVQAWKIQEQGLPFAELKIPKAYNYVGKKPPGQFGCSRCGRSYMRKDSLQRHVHWECGKEPQFQCPFCPQRCKRKAHWLRHIRRQHLDKIGDMEAYLLAYTPKLEID
ncbi:PREDICTED: zinc finger protein 569-like [Eufriesea mexicana]|uniref:zinc finger protein 569-like n=1 Tax=Eufriesea mexicana TaxID=516756 RepID=UPI00083C23AB|nr:PREDICTED: zinc finger protein 569-like [Eufriesea mexicana]